MATLEELRAQRKELAARLEAKKSAGARDPSAAPSSLPVAPVGAPAALPTEAPQPVVAPQDDPFASLREPEAPPPRPSVAELMAERDALRSQLSPEDREQAMRFLRGGTDPDVITTPIPLPEDFLRMRDRVDAGEAIRREREEFRPESAFPTLEGDVGGSLLEEASKRGVLTDQPAPFGAIAESSFGLGQKDQLKAIQRGIEAFTGEETELRIGETGELEYLHTDLETGERRFSFVNELGVGRSDVAAAAGPAIVGLFEAGGAALAFVGARGRLKGAGIENVSAVSAGLGEMVRLKIGSELGLNEELDSVGDFALEGAKMAGITKVSSKLLRVLTDFGKFAFNWMEGKPILPSVAKRIQEKFALNEAGAVEAEAVQTQINEVLRAGGREPVFELNLAQRTGDRELLNEQAALKNDPFVGPLLQRRREQLQSSSEDFFGVVSKDFDAPFENAPDAVDLGHDISQLILEGMTSERRVAAKITTQAKLEERRAIRALSPEVKGRDVTPEDVIPNVIDSEVGEPFRSKFVGNPLREALSKEYEALAYGFTNAFEGLKAVSGVTAIPLTNTRKAVADITKKTSKKFFPTTTKARESLVVGFDVDLESASPELVADRLKIWNDKLRKGSIDPTLDRLALLDLKNALEVDSTLAYGKTPADMEMWQALKQQYGEFKDLYNRGAVAAILKRSEGRGFDIANEKVFQEYWKPNNDTVASNLRTALNGQPEALSIVRRGILAEYKEAVVKDGHIDPKAHKEWITKFEGNIKPFFTEVRLDGTVDDLAFKELKREPGRIGKVMQKKSEESQVLLDQINSKLETKFEAMNPGDIFKTIWHGDNFTADNLRLILPTIKKDPELFRGLQTMAHQHLKQSVTTTKKGFSYVDSGKLENYLQDFAFKGRIETLFGKEYLKNLNTLNDALTLAAREGEFIPKPAITPIVEAARVHFGPLSKANRFVSALVRTKGKAANQMMIKTLLSTEDAATFVRGASLKPGTERAIAWAASLGASEFYLVDKIGSKTQAEVDAFNRSIQPRAGPLQ